MGPTGGLEIQRFFLNLNIQKVHDRNFTPGVPTHNRPSAHIQVAVEMWESFNMAIRQFPFDGDIQTGGRMDKGALTEREVRGSIPRED